MKTPVLNIEEFKTSDLLDKFYVNRFSAHLRANKNLISHPHSHNFYLCVLFTEGSGTHEIDFNSYTISPGKVFFLKPGQTHSWKFDHNPEGFIFFHSREFYEMHYVMHRLQIFPFYYSYQNAPVLDIAPELESFSNLFQNLYEEYGNAEPLRELKLLNNINEIYIRLTRNYTSTIDLANYSNPTYLKILGQLEHHIDTYFEQEKLPKFYANLLSITTKHLNRVVNETLNKTTNQLISERVILEAKRLIVHSADSLAGIAENLGFADYAYFSRYFKSKTGSTPLDFRKKYL
ncbi:helix-turn-helix domain-containing protein [Leeuwenhoekiella parthenopeia]|uniref:Helix-turn-helix transcriptional regulator n=1 Tax=Leeuwenhoekiella parthenopeia TaxID=2890320 RepID=A0ABS8GT27_9FLAO|nr:helix-turn-helix domain-containing protein [Leeuwenhoekiella parthenopeia]MCC4213084.1 helix-turn-helix transcriptional regulator [Leeuwenhoekiella parthenopeia]